MNPYWIEDKALKRGEVDYMPGAEVQFFKDLIEKYLHPLIKNPQEQVSLQFPPADSIGSLAEYLNDSDQMQRCLLIYKSVVCHTILFYTG